MPDELNPKPLVSVILPTYNRASLLGETIRSVLNQSYQNIELVIVDDGSTDGTKEVLQEFQDKRLRIFYLKHSGRSAARNFALSIFQGEYLTFIDSDDLYRQNKIEKQVDFLNENAEIGMVYTSAECFVGDDILNIVHKYNADVSGEIYKYIAAYIPTIICLPTVMLRKEVIERGFLFDVNLDRFEDTDFWRRISKEYLIGAIPEFTCLIRTHEDNSIRTQKIGILIDQVRTYGQKVLKEDSNRTDVELAKLVGNFYQHYGVAISQSLLNGFKGIKLYFRGLILSEMGVSTSDEVLPLDRILNLVRGFLKNFRSPK